MVYGREIENGSGKAGNTEQYQLRQITRCFIRWCWLAIKREEGRDVASNAVNTRDSPHFLFLSIFLAPFIILFFFYSIFYASFFASFFLFLFFILFLYLHSRFLSRKEEIVEWMSSSYCRNYWSFSHGNLINMFPFFFFFLFFFFFRFRLWN